jgi:hypothetical protein
VLALVVCRRVCAPLHLCSAECAIVWHHELGTYDDRKLDVCLLCSKAFYGKLTCCGSCASCFHPSFLQFSETE